MSFELRITSLHEFLTLVRVIRGQDLNDEDIQKLTQIITKDTESLKKAIDSQTGEKDAKPGP